MKEIKSYHAKYPDIIIDEEISSWPEADVQFSAEEAFGKHVDLHPIYDFYINLPSIKRVSYLIFLDVFDKFDQIPRAIKSTPKYKHYLKALLDYLQDFYKRSQPLVFWDELIEETSKGFEDAWDSGSLKGWDANPSAGDDKGINLDSIRNVEELIALGATVLKDMLLVRGLKCGGTVEQRAERLFTVKTLPVDKVTYIFHLDFVVVL
jgi:splicing factor 3A subunit 3